MEAGLVGGEPRPLDLHPPEGTHGDVAIRLPVPGTAPVLQPQAFLRGLPHEGLHRVLVGEPVPSGDGVVGVLVEAVRLFDHGGGSSLRRDGMAAHGIHLGDHGDAEFRIRLGHGDGSAQAPAPPPPTTSTSQVNRSITLAAGHEEADRRGHWDGQCGRGIVVREPELSTSYPSGSGRFAP